ncbi:MAG TPA: RelA/SpoT domain-containing protein [Solirubrobacterales bacterium]|jgi:ppGpp synthetase/RelA/SpoT-type nucleotidyltranferase|nr:RelA/SpoT domain-containing protein [Solirubrobacterales bacterium]
MAHSKSEVNRAGALFAEGLHAIIDGDVLVEPRRAEFRKAIRVIEWWRGEHAKPLSRVAANLRYYAGEEGKPVVAQRLKKLPTIAGKLLREPTMKLSRMADIGGVRAVLPNQDAAYRVASCLRRNWTISKFRDYVAEPKPDGYRALHLINRNRGRLIEVQLRTPRQDLWANLVEGFDRAVAPDLKFGAGPQELRDYFVALGEFQALRDQDVQIDSALLDRLEGLQKRANTFIDRETDESR